MGFSTREREREKRKRLSAKDQRRCLRRFQASQSDLLRAWRVPFFLLMPQQQRESRVLTIRTTETEIRNCGISPSEKLSQGKKTLIQYFYFEILKKRNTNIREEENKIIRIKLKGKDGHVNRTRRNSCRSNFFHGHRRKLQRKITCFLLLRLSEKIHFESINFPHFLSIPQLASQIKKVIRKYYY